MALSKTRLKLVDVARQLFAKNGLENTTMNDIAIASGKGRRTLYTYFKNKEEIYHAVIQSELERLSDRLKEVAESNLDPEQKVVQLIYTHLDLIKETVLRNGNLRAEFFRNIWLVEKMRKNFDQVERNLLTRILMEGVRRGTMEVENLPLIVDVIHYCVKGLEVPSIYGRLPGGSDVNANRTTVEWLVHRALGKKEREI